MGAIFIKGAGGGDTGEYLASTDTLVMLAAYGHRSSSAGYWWVWNPEYIEMISGETTDTVTFKALKTVTVNLKGGQYYGDADFAGTHVESSVNKTVNLVAGQTYTANNRLARNNETNYTIFSVTA